MEQTQEGLRLRQDLECLCGQEMDLCDLRRAEISENDLLFVCYMIERVARKLRQRNAHVVNKIGKEGLHHLLSSAQALHSANPLQVEADWIRDHQLEEGDFDITDVDRELCPEIPSPADMGMVYARLIDSISDGYVERICTAYNSALCRMIDNYNSSTYYEPSYVITRAYLNNGF